MRVLKYFISLLLFLFFSSLCSQIITLSFTAKLDSLHLSLNSVIIENLSQSGDTTLYYPDTVLVLGTVGIIEKNEKKNLIVYQNYPNPFSEDTRIDLFLPEKDNISITIMDILGRRLAKYNSILIRGNHSFVFYSGKERYYILSAKTNSASKSLIMVGMKASTSSTCKLVYNGVARKTMNIKSEKTKASFAFSYGDSLLFKGYSSAGCVEIMDFPSTDSTYTFQFYSSTPCPGIPNFLYGGQKYNTVQIGPQCWMKENLNIGTMIDSSIYQSNNGIIEKYCYNNNQGYCEIYGGLYIWDEIMQYVTIPGVQGICPPGWHIPTDEEWKVLEGNVDSQYGVGDPIWDQMWYRGFDAGQNLKSSYGWNSGGNGSDVFGFSGLPAGDRTGTNWSFWNLGIAGLFWSSTECASLGAYSRELNYDRASIYRGCSTKITNSLSVRCIKN